MGKTTYWYILSIYQEFSTSDIILIYHNLVTLNFPFDSCSLGLYCIVSKSSIVNKIFLKAMWKTRVITKFFNKLPVTETVNQNLTSQIIA